MRLSKAEMRVLAQFWKRGTSSVRAVLEPSRYLLVCGRFAGIGRLCCALLCQLQRAPLGKSLKLLNHSLGLPLS
jgi:hypothetical protein